MTTRENNDEIAVKMAIEIAMSHFPSHESADAESVRLGAEMAAMQMAVFKDKQYLSAEFIGKVLKKAEAYSDKRCLAAVARNIANELIMEDEL